MTLKQAYEKCKKHLRENDFEGYDFEAQALLEGATRADRVELIANGDRELDAEEEATLDELLKQRLQHIPLQYILGSWSFCGFEFFVGEGVLIPRDDTEVVVRLCLDFLKGRSSKTAIDLCAGSGAISVALNKLANAKVTAVELSDEAFLFLKKNISHNNTDIKAVKADIFDCHKAFEDGTFDLIVSNPPYIKSDEISSLQQEVLFEPRTALDGGESGYIFYESIIKNWSSKLKTGGALAFELGEGQADYVASLMKAARFGNIQIENDFGGIQRAIIGTMLDK